MKTSSCLLIRARGLIENIDVETVFRCIYDIEIRQKWDTVFDEFKKIEQISELIDVIYFSIKVIIPINFFIINFINSLIN